MKVVCVDTTGIGADSKLVALRGYIKEGETYTVLRVLQPASTEREPAYVLAEAPVVNIEVMIEAGWKSSRFVPLDYYRTEFAESEPAKLKGAN